MKKSTEYFQNRKTVLFSVSGRMRSLQRGGMETDGRTTPETGIAISGKQKPDEDIRKGKFVYERMGSQKIPIRFL